VKVSADISDTRTGDQVSVHPTIFARGISKGFGSTQALDRVDLILHPGEVHALLGENGAGKSTLINILAGEFQPDAGEIFIHGEKVRLRDPHHASSLGISVVYQELSLCPNLTAAQNISLRRAAASPLLHAVDTHQLSTSAQQLLDRLGLYSLDVTVPVRSLSLGQRQLIEIAKALATDLKVLILDEPNSALTFEESTQLFRIIRELRDRGVAVVYVSHRLEETMRLVDRVTILRDGRIVDTGSSQHFSIPHLIRKMVGREVNHLFHREPISEPGLAHVLIVGKLNDGSLLKDVSFELHMGEILGVGGLPGSGKDELVECLSGNRNFTGNVEIGGRPIRLRSTQDVIRAGMALVPADRRGAGAFQVLSILENVVAASLEKVSHFGVLSQTLMKRLAQTYLSRMNVKARSAEQKIGMLSGGNQQKVVLARGLATEPRLLLLHEPTRGIDVGAKAEIYQILNQIAARGIAILVVSSELPELIGQCDRIIAMFEGRIAGEFTRAEATEERILASAMGQSGESITERNIE
jgi:ABC-type sugar transport system ATPase subunit